MGLSSLLARKPIPERTTLETRHGEIGVAVRVNARARAYRLAINARGEPVLTLPKSGRWTEAEAFLLRHRGWLEQRLAKLESPYRLAPGGIVPVRGVAHEIVAVDKIRGIVECVGTADGPQLHVPGGSEHARRRLIDWLKGQAGADLERACAHHAQNLDVAIAGIRMRDQTTRWGSCSSARMLNFNWRLVLAPPFVLDYVAAHEVAHILEMNHKPVFWRTVARTLPDYQRGRAWLKQNGASLMAL